MDIGTMNSHGLTINSYHEYNHSKWNSSYKPVPVGHTEGEIPSEISTVIQLYIWITYIIPFMALVFNGLSIAVFFQRRLSKAVVSTFLIAVAVCDTLAMTMILYIAYLRQGWWPLTDLGCKLSIYITAVGRLSSIWLTVFFTAERLISIKYIFKRSQLITKFNVYMMIILLIGAMLVEQSFVLVWVEKIPPGFCFNSDKEIQKKYFLTLLILNRLFNFIIPLIAVAVMNAIIVLTVRKALSQKKLRTSVRSKPCNKHKLTTMLVLVSSMNLILLIPETTSKIMELATDFNTPWVTSFTLLSDVLSYISHSCNFFFYVISGKHFRKDFVDMICCVKLGIKRQPLSGKSYTSQSTVIISSTVSMLSFRRTNSEVHT